MNERTARLINKVAGGRDDFITPAHSNRTVRVPLAKQLRAKWLGSSQRERATLRRRWEEDLRQRGRG